MDSDSVADISSVLPPAKAKLRKSPARPKATAEPPKEVLPEVVPEVVPELVPVKLEKHETTHETILPPEPSPSPLCLVALRPEQVMEVALLAALLSVGLYRALDGIEALFAKLFGGVSELVD